MQGKKYCLSCNTTYESTSTLFSMVGNELETTNGFVRPGYCVTCVITDNIFTYLNSELQDPVYTENVISMLKSKKIPDTALRLHMSMKLAQFEQVTKNNQQMNPDNWVPVLTA